MKKLDYYTNNIILYIIIIYSVNVNKGFIVKKYSHIETNEGGLYVIYYNMKYILLLFIKDH